jgi:hypothetical protein
VLAGGARIHGMSLLRTCPAALCHPLPCLQVLNLAVPILYKKLVDSLTQQSTNSKGGSKEKVCGRMGT